MEKWGANCRGKWDQERVFMIVCCCVDAGGDTPVQERRRRISGAQSFGQTQCMPGGAGVVGSLGWFVTIGEKAEHLDPLQWKGRCGGSLLIAPRSLFRALLPRLGSWWPGCLSP